MRDRKFKPKQDVGPHKARRLVDAGAKAFAKKHRDRKSK
jgi:hypothetical protein